LSFGPGQEEKGRDLKGKKGRGRRAAESQGRDQGPASSFPETKGIDSKGKEGGRK